MNKEIRRRTDVVGILPGRRYMSLELLTKSRIRIVSIEPHPTAGEPTMTTQTLTA